MDATDSATCKEDTRTSQPEIQEAKILENGSFGRKYPAEGSSPCPSILVCSVLFIVVDYAVREIKYVFLRMEIVK